MWYPTIPNPELHLNDEYFTGGNSLTSGYQPLIWIQFGGPKGTYLQYVRGICVTRLRSLCYIEFEYDTEDVPSEVRKLGRHKSTLIPSSSLFQIDGRAGEFIKTIAVSFIDGNSDNSCRPPKYGKLGSFKVSTLSLKRAVELAILIFHVMAGM